MVGRTLGHYEILEQLGAGGMGEVYRAHDTNLDRDVAIKVLPQEMATDSKRLARFEREAKLLATLNHPNIAAIYGRERSDGTEFFVLELVDGETLETRLQAGRLQTDEALGICGQIAEALEAAHDGGIIHRDLKPANVMVTLEGRVKVLDFGIAKALEADDADTDLLETAKTGNLTTTGTLLGTAPYMSPEHIRGQPLDRRTDVWSFGCVMYEVLTSRRAFDRETVADTLAAIIEHEPDLRALPPDTPPMVAALVRRCLQKTPERRMRDIGDARIEIEEALAGPADPLPEMLDDVGRSRSRRSSFPWGFAAVITVVAAAAATLGVWYLITRAPSESVPLRSFAITIPQEEPLAVAQSAPLGVGRPSLALSPDGTSLVYVAEREGVSQLFLRQMEQISATPIAGTEGAFSPFFSPNGEWVGFFTASELMKVSIRGGEPVVLCEARNPYGASWGDEGTIIWADAGGAALARVVAEGGEPEILDERSLRWWPQVLPSGNAILYTGYAGVDNPAQMSIAVHLIDTGEDHVLLRGGAYARYVPSGHLVFGRAGTLVAVPFDISRLEVTGQETTVLEGVRTEAGEGAAQVAYSDEGSLVYIPGSDVSSTRPVWVDRAGDPEPLPVESQPYGAFRLSPDGESFAVAIAGARSNIWIYTFSRGAWARLTTDQDSKYPVWTSDGGHVVYQARGDPDWSISRKPIDGSGEEEILIPGRHIPLDWSPAANVLAYTAPNPSHPGHDLWVISFEQGGEAQPFVNTRFVEGLATFSPDGKWIAYFSDESGRSEVYVKPYPGAGGSARYQVSSAGGEEPRWSPRGDELFYRNGRQWMAVDVTTDPEFSAGVPRLLFEGSYLNVPGSSFDVSADGQRFLVLEEGGPAVRDRIHVLVNWLAELERLAPTEQ